MDHIFYTVKEIVKILKASRRSVLSWIYAGKLKAFKPGGGRLWRIRERDLKRFVRDGSDARKHSADGAKSFLNKRR
jgi:excisionase family DNA binding protein